MPPIPAYENLKYKKCKKSNNFNFRKKFLPAKDLIYPRCCLIAFIENTITNNAKNIRFPHHITGFPNKYILQADPEKN